MPTSAWRENDARRRLLRSQSEHLADQLESVGHKARIIRAKDDGLMLVGAVSGIRHEVQQYRNINLIPAVAQSNRAIYRKELEFFLKDHPYTRYAVLTGGTRVAGFGRLQDEMKALSRRISKWAKACRDEWNVHVFTRIFEFPRNEDGTYHLHANVLYEPQERMTEERWKAFLEWSHKVLKYHWKDNGRIKNLREIVKYPFKPESLNGIDAEELGWLHSELFNRRIFTAFGQFADFRKSYKAKKLKLVSVGGQVQLMKKEVFVVRDEAARELSEKTEDFDLDYETGELIKQENQFLAVTTPTYMSGPVAEPYILVRNYRPWPRGEASMARFADILYWQMKARDAFEKNCEVSVETLQNFWKAHSAGAENVELFPGRKAAQAEPSYSVHNTTITVRTGLDDRQVITLDLYEKAPLKSSTALREEPKRRLPQFLQGLKSVKVFD